MWPAYLLGGAAIAATAAEAPSLGTRASRFVGATLGGAGLAIFAAGIRPFGSFSQLAGRETGGLITGGVYRYSRNPQYVGNLLLSVGAAVAARSKPAWVFTLVAAAAYSGYVPAEEAHLERVFEDEYRRYRDRSRRWLGLPVKFKNVGKTATSIYPKVLR